jgi:hypothetical protein
MARKVLLISMVAFVAAGVAVAGEAPWFDMEKCAMCKNIFKNPELMANMTWDQYNLSNGIISITTVNEKYIDAYRTAHADMEKVSAKLQKGEKLDLCGSCNALGAAMAQGAKQEYVVTSNGSVWIITSAKPEVVTALQGWAKRNNEEMAKMEEAPTRAH